MSVDLKEKKQNTAVPRHSSGLNCRQCSAAAFLICQIFHSFDLTLNVMQKVENSLSSEKRKKEKKPYLHPQIEASIRNTPSLEVFVWYLVCTCYGIPVTVRSCGN